MFQRIFTSVSDKSGLSDFLHQFTSQGATVVSSGGTAKHLSDSGIRVEEVSNYTGFPEILDGRVKTLHPKVHMGLLYRESNPEDMKLLSEHDVQPFDLVVVNLYPFARAQDEGVKEPELIEYIDIGGPSLLRAAAKNFQSICVVCDPRDYAWIMKKSSLTLDDRRYLAAKVFQKVSSYDQMICNHLYDQLEGAEGRPKPFHLRTDLVSTLRYGENPHQNARWYKTEHNGLHQAEKLQGKELSYNNLLDLSAACQSLRQFSGPTVVSVKHNNPCGIGSSENSLEALKLSLGADPVSVFGGIIALNFEVEASHAESLTELFLECVVAPSYSEAALELLQAKKNLRVLNWDGLLQHSQRLDVRSIDGGLLVQDSDNMSVDASQWKFIGKEPSSEKLKELAFAWKAAACIKSNGIAVTAGCQTLGLGMGQVNRVDAVKQSLDRVEQFHAEKEGLILASDAFFPFPDSVVYAAKKGVEWVVQPGGSIKDDEVIEAAKNLGVNMVLTGRRHFKH